MNALIFFIHIALVLSFVLGALRLGKSALIALAAVQGVLANLFVVKQMELFSWVVTCTDVFAIGTILSLNLLQEYFGKEAARQAIRISFLALLFFAVMSQIHLLYLPAAVDETQGAFQQLFSHSFRILSASILTFYLVQRWDLFFFGHLKGALPLRIALSLFCSQLLDTLLFSFLGLYGLVESIASVIFLSLIVKYLIVVASAPFTFLCKRFVKNELSL